MTQTIAQPSPTYAGGSTEAGAREDIRVLLAYLADWLGGKVEEPAAAARAADSHRQLRQCLRFETWLDDGFHFSRDLFEHWMQEELLSRPDRDRMNIAARMLYRLVTDPSCETIPPQPALALLDD